MAITFTKQQAADAVAAARDERDSIQANLLDLDGSFGKRLLAGATLTGTTRQRWESAAGTLAALWNLYEAYSAVIDRAAEALDKRPGQKELAEITALLTGPSVEVDRGPAPLARRDLADAGREQLTLATARARMRGAFTEVTGVVSAAEQAWNDVAGTLDAAARDLSGIDALGDQDLGREVAEARAELDRLRGLLNTDPLGDQVNPAAVNRLRDRAAAVAARSADLARLRDGAQQRIAAITAAEAAAHAAREDAAAACARAAAKITAVPAVPADRTDLSARIAALDSLLAAGRWTRLSSELDLLERELASATSDFRDTERTVAGLLGRRDELRGLLDAYKAKAGRLGAAEDPGLAARYDQARELLWTAPCDLNAAADAVSNFQQAVLAIGAQRS
jgi:hypothetical protein